MKKIVFLLTAMLLTFAAAGARNRSAIPTIESLKGAWQRCIVVKHEITDLPGIKLFDGNKFCCIDYATGGLHAHITGRGTYKILSNDKYCEYVQEQVHSYVAGKSFIHTLTFYRIDGQLIYRSEFTVGDTVNTEWFRKIESAPQED